MIHYLRCDLDLWFEHLQRIACDVIKLCTKFERNRKICGGVIEISVFDLMTLNMFKCCARLWDDFYQVWPLTTYPCLNCIIFDSGTLCQTATLTFDPLTLKVHGTSSVMWSKFVPNLSEIEQSPAELLIILWIFAHVMSRRDLDLWPLNLELLRHFGCHAFKLCTKFERNPIIHGWDIDYLACFRVQV